MKSTYLNKIEKTLNDGMADLTIETLDFEYQYLLNTINRYVLKG